MLTALVVLPYAANAWSQRPSAVEAQRALGLDPMSPNTRQNQLFIFYLARRYDEALAQAHETIEIDPTYLATKQGGQLR